MNFVVSSSELLKQLSIVNGVVPNKAVLPITLNILFDIQGSVLTLTGTDLENSVRTTISVDSSEDIKIALPAKIILDTLKALPDQPLNIHVNLDQFSAEIHTDNGNYKISGFNGDDFPRIPPADNTQAIQMPLTVLVRAIDKVLFAAAQDDMRPAMSGMFFDFKTTGATFVATDAHRLVRFRRTDVVVEKDVNFILPPKALKLLTSAAAGKDLPVKIEYNASNAFFHFGENLLVCRFIDSKYPDYNNVIPKSNDKKLIISKNELVGSLKRLNIYAAKSTHLGKFQITASKITINAEDSEFANGAKETLIPSVYEGEDLEIGFNLSFMNEVIQNIVGDELIIEMNTPGKAAIILPTAQEEHENILMLIMPIMLNY